ncbi:unnamed protein product, partial [Coregonus sp. 'balchen']
MVIWFRVKDNAGMEFIASPSTYNNHDDATNYHSHRANQIYNYQMDPSTSCDLIIWAHLLLAVASSSSSSSSPYATAT